MFTFKRNVFFFVIIALSNNIAISTLYAAARTAPTELISDSVATDFMDWSERALKVLGSISGSAGSSYDTRFLRGQVYCVM